jgi:hypothetical protein
MPRVRPKGTIEFHAHAVEEALFLEDQPVIHVVRGQLSSGEPYRSTVQLPHPFPYLMMKLNAFHDRKDDLSKDLGRRHALDLYAIVGMMTEAEYDRARELGARGSGEHAAHAKAIVRGDFSDRTAIGILRLREHPLFRRDFQLDDFVLVLREIFPAA